MAFSSSSIESGVSTLVKSFLTLVCLLVEDVGDPVLEFLVGELVVEFEGVAI